MTIITVMIPTLLVLALPVHDELGTCGTSLVSPEQSILCIPV